MDPFESSGDRKSQLQLERFIKENRELRASLASMRLEVEEANQRAAAANTNNNNNNSGSGGKRKSTVGDGEDASALKEKLAARDKQIAELRRRVAGQSGAGGADLEDELGSHDGTLDANDSAESGPQTGTRGGSNNNSNRSGGANADSQIKQMFEGFALEVAEQQEAFKLVYQRLYTEMREKDKLISALQQGSQAAASSERVAPLANTTPSTFAASTKAQPSVFHSPLVAAPPQFVQLPPTPSFDKSAVADILHKMMSQIEDLSNEVGVHLGGSASTSRKRNLAAQFASSNRTVEGGVMMITNGGMTGINNHYGGAAAMGSSGERSAADDLRSIASSTTTTNRVGRPRKTEGGPGKTAMAAAKRMRDERDNEASARTVSLMQSLAATSSPSNAPASAAQGMMPGAHRAAVNFSEDPIADYCTLLDSGNSAPDHKMLLRRQLLQHCNDDNDQLARACVAHFLSKAAQSASTHVILQQVQKVDDIHSDLFLSFAAAAVERLSSMLGPESGDVDYSPQLRSLTMALRLWNVLNQKKIHESASAGSPTSASRAALPVPTSSAKRLHAAVTIGSIADEVSTAHRRLREWASSSPSSPTPANYDTSLLDIPQLLLYEACVSVLRRASAFSSSSAASVSGGGVGDRGSVPGKGADSEGEPGSGAAVLRVPSLFVQWSAVVHTMFEESEDTINVLKYYANEDGHRQQIGMGANQLQSTRRSLVWFAMQSTVSEVYFSSVAACRDNGNPEQNGSNKGNISEDLQVYRESWFTLCDSIGWSHSMLPVEGMTDAAVKQISTLPSSPTAEANVPVYASAVMSLRLFVLSRGFTYLQTIKDKLQTTKAAVQDSRQGGDSHGISSPNKRGGIAVDNVFAQLLSVAVSDLRLLSTTQDEQYQLVMGFFKDYLKIETVSSTTISSESDVHTLPIADVSRLIYDATWSHLLVANALLNHHIHSTGSSHDTSDISVRKQAEQWLRIQHAAWISIQGTAHPQERPVFADTILGQQLTRKAMQVSR